MKKLLIPILATAAIAPVATSMVACSNSTIKLEFGEIGGSDVFFKQNVNIRANKEYKVIADFSLVSDKILHDYDDCSLGFVGFTMEGEDIIKQLKYDSEKFKITLNNKDVTDFEEEEGRIWVGHHTWTKTDKLIITIVWTESQNNAWVAWIPD